jgi:hypothetical protein
MPRLAWLLTLWALPFAAEAADLAKLAPAALVACFKDPVSCDAGAWPIADELARRGGLDSLMADYWRTPDRAIRAGIEKVAYRHDSTTALDFMKRIVNTRVDDGEGRYYPLNYLAKRCMDAGLKALATGDFRNQGGQQYATSIELFGKCGYRPAVPYLVDEALWDSSLNVVIAAENSLRQLYPGSPSEFGSPLEARSYFCGRATAEMLRVRCATKLRGR